MTKSEDFLPLALAGEKYCREGDFSRAVAAFREALDVGTEDLAVLSAVYIQLGNAYFHLEQYEDALEYHTRDLHIARSIHDEKGEAKASGNIATTLKSLNRFEEALICAQRQLELCKTFRDDPAGVSRALYNAATVAHAKAKAYTSGRHPDSTDLPETVKSDLETAADYYLQNYHMVLELQDVAAQGRVCGNLGNVYYLLGDFTKALAFHQIRLILAVESHDVLAQRRAQTNLGNCHVFLGQYPLAVTSYQRALDLVDVSKDRASEAQACYSLANCHTLMHEHYQALQLYQRHLAIATEMADLPAQAAASLSLGCTYAALRKYSDAVRHTVDYRRLCQELGDTGGCSTAEAQLQEYTQLAAQSISGDTSSSTKDGSIPETIPAKQFHAGSSQPQQELVRLTPDILAAEQDKRLLPLFAESLVRAVASPAAEAKELSATIPLVPFVSSDSESIQQNIISASSVYLRSESRENQPDEEFFDLLSRFQSKRLDDQRCEVTLEHSIHNGKVNSGCHQTPGCSISSREELMDFIAGIQSKRIDAQRAELPTSAAHPLSFPASEEGGTNKDSFPSLFPPGASSEKPAPQADPPTGSVTDENYPAVPLRYRNQEFIAALMSAANSAGGPAGNGAPRNSDTHGQESLPDSFYDMLMKVQKSRMDDQRCTVNLSSNRPAPVPAENFSTIAQGRRLDNPRGADVSKSSSKK